MKILIILPSLLTGGGQKVAMDIAADDRNFLFLIIGKRENNQFTKSVESKHKVYYMNKELGFDLKIFHKIGKILDFEKPDVVHFHLAVSLYGLIPCWLRKIKTVYTFHTIASKDSEGLVRWLCRLGIKLGGMVPVAITETVRESIQEMYNISQVEMIYNGIDLQKYYKVPFIDPENVQLIAIGQIWEAKNHHFLVDVMRMIKISCPKKHYKLVILGDGPLRQSLEEYINQSGVNDIIELKGNVNNVEDYLARSNIFVISSRYEGLSLATMEAMASSLPVVSLNVGGMKDLVSDNGYLVEFGDVEEFTKKVLILGENEVLQEKMGTRSKEKVKKYGKQQMRVAYLNLYRRINEVS